MVLELKRAKHTRKYSSSYFESALYLRFTHGWSSNVHTQDVYIHPLSSSRSSDAVANR